MGCRVKTGIFSVSKEKPAMLSLWDTLGDKNLTLTPNPNPRGVEQSRAILALEHLSAIQGGADPADNDHSVIAKSCPAKVTKTHPEHPGVISACSGKGLPRGKQPGHQAGSHSEGIDSSSRAMPVLKSDGKKILLGKSCFPSCQAPTSLLPSPASSLSPH